MFNEKEYRKQYYLKNKEKILARQKIRSVEKREHIKDYQKKFYSEKEGRIVRFLAATKKRAKAKNLPYDLTLKYLRSIALDKCPIFDLELDWSSWGEKNQIANDNSPSVDRIDPKKGYVVGNVIWLSWKANRLKSNATSEDLFKIAKWLEQKESENGNKEQTKNATSIISEHSNSSEGST
jgi:hypothetical protein